jgi:hypothetical protein
MEISAICSILFQELHVKQVLTDIPPQNKLPPYRADRGKMIPYNAAARRTTNAFSSFVR